MLASSDTGVAVKKHLDNLISSLKNKDLSPRDFLRFSRDIYVYRKPTHNVKYGEGLYIWIQDSKKIAPVEMLVDNTLNIQSIEGLILRPKLVAAFEPNNASMTYLYSEITRNTGYYIISDEIQTTSAMKIWLNWIKKPNKYNLILLVVNTKTNKIIKPNKELWGNTQFFKRYRVLVKFI